MTTQTYFKNSQHQIIRKIKLAKKEILIAVTWLTD